MTAPDTSTTPSVVIEFALTEDEARQLDELVDFFGQRGHPTNRANLVRACMVDSFEAFREVRDEEKNQ
jgi:hypothetical protein